MVSRKSITTATIVSILVLSFVTLAIATSAGATGIRVDGSATKGCGYVLSCNLTLTTTQSEDIIIVACDCWPSGAVFSVSDSSGLTFTQREAQVGVGGGQFMQSWYAIAPTPLTSDTVTISTTRTGETWYGALTFAVTGANTSSPFVPGFPISQANLKCAAPCNTGVVVPAGSFVFQVGGDTGSVLQTAGSGMTLITASRAGQDAYSQYMLLTTTGFSGSLLFGTNQGSDFAVIADALQSAQTITTTSTTTTTSSSSSTSTSSTSSTTSSSTSTTNSTSSSSTTSSTSSSTSSSSTSTTTTNSSSTIAMGGRWNDIITNSGSDITNFTMTGTLSQNVLGSSSGQVPAVQGNLTLILNLYAPTQYQNKIFTQIAVAVNQNQFLFSYDVFESSSGLAYKLSYPISSSEIGGTTPSPFFKSGQSLSIGFLTNSSGDIIYATVGFTEALQSGTFPPATETFAFQFPIGGFYSTPVLAINPVLVGYPDGGYAQFTSGQINIKFSASSPISWQPTVPSYVWQSGYINETSNSLYQTPVQVASSEITQVWVC